MLNKLYDVKNEGFIVENYNDVETKQAYDLLIYQCTINNIDRTFVVGSIIDKNGNIDAIKEYISKIIFFRLWNLGELFILGAMHDAEKNNAFNNINFSNEAYKLLINCQSDEYFKEKFIFCAKETVLDRVTKRFSTIHTTVEPFHPITYYIHLNEQKDNGNQKTLKPLI